MRSIMKSSRIAWVNNAAVALAGCLLLGGGVVVAEEEEDAEGGFHSITKAVRTVKSLMGHRRQDVREAEQKKEMEEKQKREAEENEKNVTLKHQFKLVENLLEIRIDEMLKLPKGTTIASALDVVLRHAAEHKKPFRVEWAEGQNAEENNRLKLKGEVNLYGCMASEAIARICEAANCGFTVRGRHVELEYYGKNVRVEQIPCPQAVFSECFISNRVRYDANGKKHDARPLPYQRNTAVRYTYEIKEKRIGKLLDYKLSGEYDPETGLLELRGTRLGLLQCRKEIDDAYHLWVRSAKVKTQGVQDTTSQRYKVERKLNALPVVPIVFAERCTLNEVVQYLNLVAGKSRIKLLVKFAAERGQEDTLIREKIVIPHSTFLDAVFCVSEAIHGSYTVQGTKLTFVPRELERRSYECRRDWETLVVRERDEQKTQPTRTPKKNRFEEEEEEEETPDEKKLRMKLEAIGLRLPESGSIDYSGTTSNYQMTWQGKIVEVEADPRSHFHLNRLFRYFKIIENP